MSIICLKVGACLQASIESGICFTKVVILLSTQLLLILCVRDQEWFLVYSTRHQGNQGRGKGCHKMLRQTATSASATGRLLGFRSHRLTVLPQTWWHPHHRLLRWWRDPCRRRDYMIRRCHRCNCRCSRCHCHRRWQGRGLRLAVGVWP